MSDQTIKVRVSRFDPSVDAAPRYQDYLVPLIAGMSAMDALDYIYQNLDPTLAYYDHAGCSLGICGPCAGKINGKAGLLCQTALESDAVIEPSSKERVLRDLVAGRTAA